MYILKVPDPRVLPLKAIIATSTPLPPIILHLLHEMAAKIWVATNKYKRGAFAPHPCQHGCNQPSDTGSSVIGIHWNGKPQSPFYLSPFQTGASAIGIH